MPIYVYKIRKQKKLSLRQLAKLSGVSLAQISKIERGLSDPTFSVMCKIAIALKVPYQEVFVCDDSSKNE